MTDLLAGRLFAPLALSAIGALALLVLVLMKGDLCPGQRRRISDGLVSVWAVLGLSLMLGVEAKVPSLMLGWGALTLIMGLAVLVYQARLAGKRSLSITWQWPASLMAAGLAVWIMFRVGPAGLFMLGAGGCVFGHLIMVRAKHRLQAFNVLLPLVGVGFSLLFTLVLVVQASIQADALVIESLVWPFGQLCGLVLAGALVWLWPVFRKEATSPPVLAVATLLILGALTLGQSIIWQLA
ncbi:hypothetical protein [Oceanisphaera avium]|uniref:Uncharacterized protein n=1 Tax=Oceanisphaera avium TaxID=1903694 RepID=A0A1Y0CVE5_9GAMM|nr:hypothetical protein [Oceanisphaera avium]ART79209.1 hypothetical protein CBP12_02815 [Oceanisphaera avium]